MSYCGNKSQDGWLCVLKKGHKGNHLSIDNTRSWRGSPGQPIWWGSAGAEAPELPKEDQTLTQSEYAREQGYTGETCGNCQGMRMRRNGTCQLCDDCGMTTGCS